MSFSSVRALRSVQSSLGRVAPRVAARRTQLVAKRFASSGHGAHAPSSDLPWLISGLVITPVSCWYLWPTSHAEAHHGHDDHSKHEETHAEEKEEESTEEKDEPAEEKEPSKDESSSEATEAPEEKAEEKSEEKSEGDDEESTSSEDASEGDAKKSVSGKGRFRADSDAANTTRKIEPSTKGGNKIRIDSGLGKNLGHGINSNEEYNGSESVSIDSNMVNKQKGLSNTDTRHSIAIDAPGTELSTKGSGGPETAKHKGTVDSNAPLK